LEATIIVLIEQERYKIDEYLTKQGDVINVVQVVQEVCANLRRGCPCNVPNPVTIEKVSVPPDPKVYNMIDEL